MIRTYVWTGEYDPKEVGIIVEEHFGADPDD